TPGSAPAWRGGRSRTRGIGVAAGAASVRPVVTATTWALQRLAARSRSRGPPPTTSRAVGRARCRNRPVVTPSPRRHNTEQQRQREDGGEVEQAGSHAAGGAGVSVPHS